MGMQKKFECAKTMRVRLKSPNAVDWEFEASDWF